MTKFLNEFKAFAMKGNVVDLAVGVIIGAAFGKIVTSMVDNIITPPMGLLVGGIHFNELKIVLKAAGADGKGEVAMNLGLFVQDGIDFLIVAFTLFLVIRLINEFKKPSPGTPPPPTPEDVLLLREIRDSLKK